MITIKKNSLPFFSFFLSFSNLPQDSIRFESMHELPVSVLYGEQKKEKKRKNFLSLNCVSSVVTDHDKLTER